MEFSACRLNTIWPFDNEIVMNATNMKKLTKKECDE